MEPSLKITVLSMFIQIFLTVWTILATGKARTKVLKNGNLHIRDIALGSSSYPMQVQKQQNNMHNQFETPPMFYAAVLLAVAIPVSSWTIAGAAVFYVLARFWHRMIHVGTNNVVARFKVFVLGIVALAVMWAALAVEVFRL